MEIENSLKKILLQRLTALRAEDAYEDLVTVNNPMGLIEQAENQQLELLIDTLDARAGTRRSADRRSRTAKTKRLTHSHYYVNVENYDEIDFYRIAVLYKITDPCVQHILKKALAPGGRGVKSLAHDMENIRDTAIRWLELNEEDKNNGAS